MKSVVAGAIRNRAALNLSMIAMMVAGYFSLSAMRRETFPEFELDQITVSVPYPGAAPQEVEQGIVQKIEEAVRSIEGIKKITSTSSEGSGSVVLELVADGRDPDRVLDEVRGEVDRIPSFPQEAEDPEVRLYTLRRSSLSIGILAPEGFEQTPGAEVKMRALAEKMREDLLQIDGVADVTFMAAKEYQIDIEIPEETLRSHGLTLGRAADVIRRENRELPAGLIRSPSQEILLRGNNRRTDGAALAELPLVTEPGGGVLTVADLGTVRDEFVDTTAVNYINGRPAIGMSVLRSTTQDLLDLIDGVTAYLDEEASLPEGFELVSWGDESIEVRSRLDLLVRNGFQGLVIVLILLMLFLDPRLAFWVALGIPFALLASGMLLYLTGQTLNQISMFAFVMALGIVVDDAIVVGENVFAHRQMGKPFSQAAIDGTVEVFPSVLTAVLTTVVAFAPLLFVTGRMGNFTAVMPMAIISMLVVSLLECATILPCHLAHRDSLVFRLLNTVFYVFRPLLWVADHGNRIATGLLSRFIDDVYRPSLAWCLNNRVVVLSACLSSLIVTTGLYRSGIVQFSFFPRLDGNTLTASVVFPDGTPEQAAMQATRRIERAFWKVADQYEAQGLSIAKTSFRVVGATSGGRGSTGTGGHRGGVEVELASAEDRGVHSREIVTQWRQEVGTIVGAEELTIGTRRFGPGGTPIEFKLQGPSSAVAELEAAVEECKAQLKTYNGVSDIADDSSPGKWEYRFRIKPEAFAMGVRTSDLAETVRAAYYGEEVMRVQRGRHEVKIMVTYPREERRLLSDFNEIRVRLDDGVERPITELAEIDFVRSYSQIKRIDQARAITISADVDDDLPNGDTIVPDLQANFIPGLLQRYPMLRVRWEGQQERRSESFGSLFRGFSVALFVMFILLALEFKSTVQPLLVMSIIPFGVLGAVMGHVILGIPLTLFSFYGVIALMGIVVNDSIVLIDFINAKIRNGVPVQEALTQSGARRFRPVLLTTITTIGGLIPILMESSIQAQILIPMATSIAFGELFATVVVLYLVPVSYSLYFSAGGELSFAEEEDEVLPEASITALA
ncbi:MAG: efflux RND transporter permease subunit [Planctomycetota bacterium]